VSGVPEYEALQARNLDLEEWHKRDALAVEAHKARADHQESRANGAEERLGCFADHAERYRQLAELAATGQRDADLVKELRRRIAVLECHYTAIAAQEPKPAPVPAAGQWTVAELAAARDASDLEVAAIIAERNQLRAALQQLADDGNLEVRDRLAAIRPELTRRAHREKGSPA
jgi:hypothetical protein